MLHFMGHRESDTASRLKHQGGITKDSRWGSLRSLLVKTGKQHIHEYSRHSSLGSILADERQTAQK